MISAFVKIFCETPVSLKAIMTAGLTPVILATWEAEIGRIVVRGQPWQIVLETLSTKIIRAKWTRGVAQVVEHQLCECEAPSSNYSPTGGGKKIMTKQKGERERKG
jgi:hypothetical protein